MHNEKITLMLLPGLNGTAGLFDPLLQYYKIFAMGSIHSTFCCSLLHMQHGNR